VRDEWIDISEIYDREGYFVDTGWVYCGVKVDFDQEWSVFGEIHGGVG
jgi:hypothetical protein